jgi:hypothetical protein
MPLFSRYLDPFYVPLNCVGSLSAGVTAGFRERYPECIRIPGQAQMDATEAQPGSTWLWKEAVGARSDR